MNKKYKKIQHEIEQWNPPTSEHIEIKEFALNQIDISIEGLEYYKKRINEIQSELDNIDEIDPKKFKEDHIKSLLKDVEYYEEKKEEDRKRTDDRNLFMKQFLDSLKDME